MGQSCSRQRSVPANKTYISSEPSNRVRKLQKNNRQNNTSQRSGSTGKQIHASSIARHSPFTGRTPVNSPLSSTHQRHDSKISPSLTSIDAPLREISSIQESPTSAPQRSAMPILSAPMRESMRGLVWSRLEDEGEGEFKVVDDLIVPLPGRGQILVRGLVAGINSVDTTIRSSGSLVLSGLVVLGCDASGVVVEVGRGVKRVVVGDEVFGCTRMGKSGYGTWQELFLMDETLTFKKPDNISREQAATLGVGLLTACLGLISGANIELGSTNGKVGEEWVVILGAAGCVGQYAVQIARMCGFKVLGSCSPANDEFLKTLGADATFDYHLPLDQQLDRIACIAGRNFSRVFDASGKATRTGMEALARYGDPKAEVKHFATSNDRERVQAIKGISVSLISLERIGRMGNESVLHVNQDIEDFIPILEGHLADGSLKPMGFDVVYGVGVENVLLGLEIFRERKSKSRKVVVRIAEK